MEHEIKSPGGPFSISTHVAPDQMLSITGPQGNLLIELNYDGTVVLHPGYEPAEAAKIFWDTVQQLAKSI